MLDLVFIYSCLFNERRHEMLRVSRFRKDCKIGEDEPFKTSGEAHGWYYMVDIGHFKDITIERSLR